MHKLIDALQHALVADIGPAGVGLERYEFRISPQSTVSVADIGPAGVGLELQNTPALPAPFAVVADIGPAGVGLEPPFAF